MGYRSEWKIAFLGDEKAIASITEWLLHKKKSLDQDKERQDVFDTILCLKKDTPSENKNQVWFVSSDDDTKCYDPWDDVISEILEHARHLGLGWAYARLGEDLEGVETQNNGQIWINIQRSLGQAV